MTAMMAVTVSHPSASVLGWGGAQPVRMARPQAIVAPVATTMAAVTVVAAIPPSRQVDAVNVQVSIILLTAKVAAATPATPASSQNAPATATAEPENWVKMTRSR